MSTTAVTILENRVEARDLHHLVIDVGAGIAAGHAAPGQFVQLSVGGGKPGFYAIASAPGGARMEFLIKRDGVTSTAICDLPAGATVDSSAVMGKGFDLSAAAGRDLVLFATGSGISAIRSIIEHDLTPYKSVHLYYGCLSPSRMSYRSKFAGWAEAGVAVHAVVDAAEDGWEGPSGVFVQDLCAQNPPVDLAEAAAAVAGVGPMVAGCFQTLGAANMPADRVLKNY